MHITASVFINDNESGLRADYERWLEELVHFSAGADPASGGYLLNRTGEDKQTPTTNVSDPLRGCRGAVFDLIEGQLHLGP